MGKKIHFFKLIFLFLFTVFVNYGQETVVPKPDYNFAALEYSFGKTSQANVNFPQLKPQHAVLFSIGTTHNNTDSEWAKQLNHPQTGFTFSFADMGNTEHVGHAITIVPFIDFNLSPMKHRWNLKVGLGGSYFNKIYDPLENPDNKAISTHLTWSFRSNLYYKVLEREEYDIKLGLGYFHNSNGHMRLPNVGLNTFLISAYSELKFKRKPASLSAADSAGYRRTSQTYYCVRGGIGQKVLSKYSTQRKDVYAFSAATGKIINKTFKYGYGLYYRFYEDYYDYIREDGQLVAEMYPEMKEKPVLYSSNIGVFANGELQLGHMGVEFEIGFNVYKPAYKFDWQINEEKYVNDHFEWGELNWYYKVKKTISSRLGAKLYAINTNKSPRHNVFLGAFINANFGQADFSELTLGYVYCLPLKKKTS